MVEGVITTLVDMQVMGKVCKEHLTIFVCVCMYLFSLIFVTRSGLYVFELFDFYSAALPLLFVAFVELIGVRYVN